MTNRWQAGTAKVDITPPVGMVGSYRRAHDGKSLGIHDPLFGRVLVLDDGITRIALVGLDLVAVWRDFVMQVRWLVHQRTGIDQVMLSCSHTHSAPNTMTQGNRVDGYPPISRAWLNELAGKLAGAVVEATNNLRPVRLGWGQGQIDISYNRFHVWKGREGGAMDRDVNLLYVEDMSGTPLGLLVNYTCHPVVVMDVGYLSSGDFPGYAMERLQQELGCVSVFTNGTQGNINPQWVSRSFEEMASLGNVLVDEVLRVRKEIAVTDSPPPLAVAYREVYLPFREFPALEEVQAEVEALRAEAGATHLQAESGQTRSDLWKAERRLTLVEHYQGVTGMVTEIQAITIGDRTVVSIPGEMFVEWGLQLKERARDENGKAVVLVGLGNDLVGYIPSTEAFEEGCYETELWCFSKLVPEAGQMIVDSALELVATLP